MSAIRIASRYAQSLLELAMEQSKLDRVVEDVKSLKEVLQNRDFYLLMKSPIINGGKKKDIVKEAFGGKYDELTVGFMNILINKNRESYLPEIVNSFIDQYQKIQKISKVKITTAGPLSAENLEAIKSKLLASGVTDSNLDVTTEEDPELVGGFIMEFDDKIYDASLKHKLESLKKEFEENLYISQIIAN